jgi:tetratricopeptide (TPR) repeat protein
VSSDGARTLEAETDDLSAWLAAWDDRLAEGSSVSSAAELGAPNAIAERLEREAAFCQFVRRTWAQSSASSSPPVGSTISEGAAGAAAMLDGLGRFQLRRELGRGAFGIVYLAYDPRLRRELALKVPRAEVVFTPQLRARFRQEALAAAGLDHPNIVSVYEAGEEGNNCYIASAYCAGITLATWLRQRSGPVPYRAAAQLVATMAEAVEHAHQRGVLHRDLKPSNVLLETPAKGLSGDDSSELVPRITDFGLAKLVDEEAAAPDAPNPTQSGVILGTPSYMAPEQALGRADAAGPAADIYSLGVMLYEVLTGRPQFQEDSALDTLVLVRTQDPLPPSRLRRRLPRDLETICLTCLHKQPAGRYPSAQALADDLRRFLAAEPIRARPTPAWERALKWVRRRPAVAAIAAAGVVAGITVAAVIGVANIHLKRERDLALARRREAVANLAKAREAVDRMLTRVSEERLNNIPQVEPVRLALLEDALGFYREFARQAHDDPDVLLGASQAYGRLGRQYLWLGKADQAEQCFREAFAIDEHLAADYPGVAIYRNELAHGYMDIARMWSDRRNIKEATSAVETAVSILERLTTEYPAERRYRARLAGAYNTRGMLRDENEQVDDKAADYRKSISLLDDLANQYPGDIEYRVKGCTARNNLAVSMENLGRLDEAEKIHRQNLEVWQALAAKDPSVIDYRSKTALALENLCSVLKKMSRKPEAEQSIRRSAELRLALTKVMPDSPYNYETLAKNLVTLANLVSERGDLVETRRLQEQAIASSRKALAFNSRNNSYVTLVRDGRAALAETLIKMGEHAAANKTIAELVNDSPEPAPDRFRAAALLARCATLANEDKRLSEARRVEMASTYAGGAVELLREALKRGYRDEEWLVCDHSFDTLRTRADFREVLAMTSGSKAPTRP